MKTYSELIKYSTFIDRYNYLKMFGEIGITSFGFERSLNQRFYNSREWRMVRRNIIVRDEGCDLGILGRIIYGFIRVHHLNPISAEDFKYERFAKILDPEYLICVSLDTHNAIHFGNENGLPDSGFKERQKGDTTLWTTVS